VDGEARRGAPAVARPGFLLEAAAQHARAHEHDVAGLDVHAAALGTCVELGGQHGSAVLEPGHAAVARQVEQHAAAHHPVLDAVDRVRERAAARDEADVAVVVHALVVETWASIHWVPHWSGIRTASSAYWKPPGRNSWAPASASPPSASIRWIGLCRPASPVCGPFWSKGSAQEITRPLRGSAQASSTRAGVMKLSVPRSSSLPQRPQFE
jgi:hypothetical protein